MADATPAPAATPEPQAGDGQPEQEQPNAAALTADQLQAELKKKNSEARNLRDRLKDAEAQIAAAAQAQADAEAKRLAEQGEFKTLYEAERAKAAEAAALLARMQRDQQRRDVAQAAGIPQLWERLKGETAEELAEDAKALAEMMQPTQPANGQPARGATRPTPPAQGRAQLTDEERRARATRTF